jgi:triacylglycerol esterase/lipase EstA (alpha/beta hydrolase family)
VHRLALFLAVPTLALVAPLVTPAAAAGAPQPVSYQPPVDGPIVDSYRPPREEWLAGNRGIDYAPGRGTPVQASADGEVTFAGQVGGDLHVVVLHADGIRTSYSFLDSIAVQRGDTVRQGQVVGAAGDNLHFGARRGDEYIDPRTLFDGPPQVFLVPDDVRRPGTEVEERSGLRRFLDKMTSGARTLRAAGRWSVTHAADGFHDGVDAATAKVNELMDEARLLHHVATQFHPTVHALRALDTVKEWYKQRSTCTPAGVKPPPLPEPRVAVLVSGLGSNSRGDNIDDIDTAGLGYDRSVRFSYNGGSIEESPYEARDTTVGLRTQARRLRDLIERVHRDNPGKTIDIIAHDQGGIIARAMLAYEYDRKGDPPPMVANLVTLGTPHQGADLATALALTQHTDAGSEAVRTVDAAGWLPYDLTGESVKELSETSEFMRELNNRPMPEGVRFTSIGSRGDFVVPGLRTQTDGASSTIVSVRGIADEHGSLPGSPEARREVALAVAGMAPTCQSLGNMLADTVVSDAIATVEDGIGGSLYMGGRWLDDRTR